MKVKVKNSKSTYFGEVLTFQRRYATAFGPELFIVKTLVGEAAIYSDEVEKS